MAEHCDHVRGPVIRQPEGALQLAQAMQELKSETLRRKHAKVTAANVQIERVGDLIQIVVEDKGAGCAALGSNTPGNTGSSLGLFGIRQRLDLIGGRFEIDSVPERGSRFTLHAPLRSPPPAGRFG